MQITPIGLISRRTCFRCTALMPQAKSSCVTGCDGARCCASSRVFLRASSRWNRRIVLWCRNNEAARRLATIPGVGPITASRIAWALLTRGETYRAAAAAPAAAA